MGWASTHLTELARATAEHLVLSMTAMAVAVMIAVPLGVWAHGRGARASAVTGAASVLYTVPGIALFALLVPVFGLGWLPAFVGLVLYAQLILVRAVIAGLDSVPADVRDAAFGLGLDRWTVLTRVDAPLALPVLVSGLRTATVTIIGIATIAALVDGGGLGKVILEGIDTDYPAETIAGAVCVTLLALAVDALLVRFERRAQPWNASHASMGRGAR